MLLAAVLTFYGLSGAGTLGYLLTRRMPIEASLRRLRVPKRDQDAVWKLSEDSPVGIV